MIIPISIFWIIVANKVLSLICALVLQRGGSSFASHTCNYAICKYFINCTFFIRGFAAPFVIFNTKGISNVALNTIANSKEKYNKKKTFT